MRLSINIKMQYLVLCMIITITSLYIQFGFVLCYLTQCGGNLDTFAA